MTGQRNENSVLFSLNNLQALASGSGGAKPAAQQAEPRPGFASSQTEGSGLIDIRAMAASTLASGSAPSPSGKADEPAFPSAPLFSPMAAPILMPAPSAGPPKWIWAIAAIGVTAVLGIVIVGILLITRKPVEPVVAMVPTSAGGTTPAATGAAPTNPATPTGAAPAAPAPTGAAPAAPAETKGSEPDDKGKKHGKDKGASAKPEKGAKGGKNESSAAPSPAPAAPTPAPAAPAPTKKKGGDALDDLLNAASPDSSPKPKKQAAAAEPAGGGADLPEQLDRSAIVGGMGKVKGRVNACYDQYKVPGMANVSLTISKSGKVSNASVSGAFAGTPTGDCVERAVRSASFPPFKGAAQTIQYPYMLR
jgi:hypothetical protein